MEHDPKIILRNPERLAYLHSIQPIHFPKHKDVCDPLGQFVQATLKRLPELLVIQRGLRAAFPFRRAKRLIPTLINEFVRQRKELRLQTCVSTILQSDPLLFGVVDIKEIIDVMSGLRRHKLRDVFFHKFLDRVRHLREALIMPVIVPFNDFDPWSLLCLVFNPFSDLFVGVAGSDTIFELVC